MSVPKATLPTILLVEDSDIVRPLVARMLLDEGYTVHIAKNGLEALDLLARTAVDVVVTDLLMPRLDGRKLALEIAARWPSIRMVFMTGHPNSALVRDLPGPLVLKPFGPEELMAAVTMSGQGAGR
jgi:CheY-like chemotaxis protein